MAATSQNYIQSIKQLYENLGFYQSSSRPFETIRTLTHEWRRQYFTPSGTPGTQLRNWDQDEHDLVEMATAFLETDRNGILHWPSNNWDNPDYPAAPRYRQDEAMIKSLLSQIFWHQNKNERQSGARCGTKDKDFSESVIEISSSTSSNDSTYDRGSKSRRTRVSSGKSERSSTPLNLQKPSNYQLMQDYPGTDITAGFLEPNIMMGESSQMTAGVTSRCSKRKEPSVDSNRDGPYSLITGRSGLAGDVNKYFEKRRRVPAIRKHRAPPSSSKHPGQPRPSLEGRSQTTREEREMSVELKSSAPNPGLQMSSRGSSTSPASSNRQAQDSLANPPSPGSQGHTAPASDLRLATEPTVDKPTYHIHYVIIINRKTGYTKVPWTDGKIADRTVNEFFAVVGDQIQTPDVQRMKFTMHGRHAHDPKCVDRNDERAFKTMQRSWRRNIKGEMRETPPNFDFDVDIEIDLTMASKDEGSEDSDIRL